jgi:beta-1,4-mannosyl-glycoprotein beta-1,4-N-acetylglucosaminyltransferase
MIYDSFMFFNELELLELRCEELFGIIDRHFLIEATTTHHGTPKPLYYTENESLFKKYPITPIVLELPKRGYEDSWADEGWQRHVGTARALEGLQDSEIIMISDMDEIPRASKLLELLRNPTLYEPKAVFLMGTYTYWLDFQSPEIWNGTALMTVGHMKALGGGHEAYKKRFGFPKIEDGGWHFSYQGGLEKIREKLKGFAHTEYSGDFFTNPERIAKKMITGSDLFDRDKEGFELVSMENHPQYLLEHLDKFKYMCFSTAYEAAIASLSLTAD